jgi:hypothetical protein
MLTEVAQRLGHVRRLHRVVEVDPAVAPGMQDLLHAQGAGLVDHVGDARETRDETVLGDGQLTDVGLAVARSVRVGALVRDDPAAGAGHDLHAGELPLGDRAVRIVEVGDRAGGVLDRVGRLQPADLPRAEEVGMTPDAGQRRIDRVDAADVREPVFPSERVHLHRTGNRE